VEKPVKSKSSYGRGLRLIAAFKLLKGIALLVVGIGALNLVHKDVAAIVEHWVNIFRVDPHNHYINLLLEKLSIVDDRLFRAFFHGRNRVVPAKAVGRISYDHHNFFPTAAGNLRDCQTRQRRKNLCTFD
jgi:hypothetical protein